MTTIKHYVDKFLFFRITFLVFRYLITCINTIVGGFILSVLIDKVLPLPIVAFHIYWFVILGILGVFFLNLVLRLLQVIQQPVLQLQKLLANNNFLSYSDDLINAYLLEKKLLQPQTLSFSDQLASNFVKDIKEKLLKIDLIKLTGFVNLYKVLPLNFVLFAVIIILYALPPYIIKPTIHKIIFTRRPEILGIFVSPKNARVRFGEPCEIKVIVDKDYSIYVPELLIKSAGMKKFNKVKFEKTSDFANRKIYRYTINSVESVLLYKIKFRGVTSKQYVIEPIISPQISRLDIKVFPPEYVKRQSYSINSFSETKYLYGSNVQFKGETNKAVSEIYMYLYGEKVKLNLNLDQRTFSGSFITKQNTELWFEIIDTEGRRNEEIIKYKIETIEDLPPQIQILSPATDIIVEPNSIIPIIFSVKDDFGVTKVELIYEVDKKISKMRKQVKSYVQNITEDVDEYQFDLGKLKLNFGDVVKYRMIVYDNDSLRGYKYDITDEFKIEIFSYEKRHNFIQQQVEKFTDKAVKLLADEIKFYDTLLSLTTSYVVETDKLVYQSQNKISEYKDLELLLDEIISQMSVDPYTSVDTLMEFNGLRESIRSLHTKLGPARSESLKQNDTLSAQNVQEQIIDVLERASILTKDIIRRQNLENLNRLAKQNIASVKDLIETLQDATKDLSEEDKLKINNLLLQIEDRLRKIHDKLIMARKELPDEFVNQREIQNLNFVTPMEILNNILEVVKKGDIKTAIKLAEELLKQLDLLANRISTAAGEYLDKEMSGLSVRMNRVVTKLDKIIMAQQEIYQDTKKIDGVRILEVEKFQEKQLAVLEQKCKDVITSIESIASHLDTVSNFFNKEVYRLNLGLTHSKIQSLHNEIKNKRLLQSLKYIEESLSIWEQNVRISSAVQQNFNILFSSTVLIMHGLNEIAKILQTEPKIVYPPKVDAERVKLRNTQINLYSEMENFITDLKSLGKKSFIVNSEDIATAVSARTEMKNSAEALDKSLIPEALQHQNLALNQLFKLRNNFSSKQEQLQQITQQLGQPVAGGVQVRPQPGGKIGVLTAPVELPSANEYRPPKEIREEIIKSLSEKYPEELRYAIEQYYKEVLK